VGDHSLIGDLSWRELNKINLAYIHHKLAGWLAQLTVGTFINQLGQYASSPGNTELAISSLAVAVWLSGSIVGHINEVTLCRAGLMLRWVTVRGYTILVFNQATQANSAWSSLRR